MKKKKEKRGGQREGAGRRPGPVPKKNMVVSVPLKYIDEIKEKTVKLAKAYEEKCKEEL